MISEWDAISDQCTVDVHLVVVQDGAVALFVVPVVQVLLLGNLTNVDVSEACAEKPERRPNTFFFFFGFFVLPISSHSRVQSEVFPVPGVPVTSILGLKGVVIALRKKFDHHFGI